MTVKKPAVLWWHARIGNFLYALHHIVCHPVIGVTDILKIGPLCRMAESFHDWTYRIAGRWHPDSEDYDGSGWGE